MYIYRFYYVQQVNTKVLQLLTHLKIPYAQKHQHMTLRWQIEEKRQTNMKKHMIYIYRFYYVQQVSTNIHEIAYDVHIHVLAGAISCHIGVYVLNPSLNWNNLRLVPNVELKLHGRSFQLWCIGSCGSSGFQLAWGCTELYIHAIHHMLIEADIISKTVFGNIYLCCNFIVLIFMKSTNSSNAQIMESTWTQVLNQVSMYISEE